MDFRVSRYSGFDKIDGYDRYAIEYGNVLLGVVGAFDFNDDCVEISNDPANPASWLEPVPEKSAALQDKGQTGI